MLYLLEPLHFKMLWPILILMQLLEQLSCNVKLSNFQCYRSDTFYTVLIHLHRHLSRHGRWWIAIRHSERTRKPYKIGPHEELLLCSPSALQCLCWTSWRFVADSDTNSIVTCFESRLSYWAFDQCLLTPCNHMPGWCPKLGLDRILQSF